MRLHLLDHDVVQLEVEFELEAELMQIYYFILQLHFVVESSPPSLISVFRAMQLRCFQGSPSLHPLYNVIYDFQIFIYSLQFLQHKCSVFKAPLLLSMHVVHQSKFSNELLQPKIDV